MSTKPFKFKEFTVQQDRCAMKIGTDGVLLGAWTSLKGNPFSVLDIGAGTGLIALMLAQRSNAELIDAIEIDDDAYEQCVGNFETSSWGDRLFCYHAGFDEFVEEIEDKYDLIISNPPFYTEDFTSHDNQREKARSNFSLPFEDLLKGVSLLLSSSGVFSIIIPYKEEVSFLELASKNNLFPNRVLRVKGNPTSEVKRSLIELSFLESDCNYEELIIEKERHKYTTDYIELTKDFYLKM
ncbi:tRNA1(Val) (adenine(37)-N6)-methyltransferase [Joostella sp.]|uniref:tRNA1(Val) (adenine(37)-N6)-methyltransferase n=1 Tax=Joostella sp. TaxID=2231138 RepID=UPI003A8EA681